MSMEITPEQARAELARRQGSQQQITPEQAQAELERRRNPGMAGKIARGMKSWADGLSFGDNAMPMYRQQGKVLQGGTKMMTNLLADTIQDPWKTWVVDPIKAVKGLPGNTYHSARQYMAQPMMFDPEIMGDMGNSDQFEKRKQDWAVGQERQAQAIAERPNAKQDMIVGGMEALGIIPLLKGPAKAGAKGVTDAAKPAAKTMERSDPIAAALERAIKAEGKNPQEIRSQLPTIASGKSPDMLFQALGLDQTAQALGNRAGPSRGIMQEAATAQQRGQRGRVEGFFKDALDNPDFDASTEAIESLYREKGSPLYEAAFKAEPNPSDAMKAAISNPGIKGRLETLGDRLVKDGVDVRKFKDGREGRLMQLLKEDLDDEIGVALRKGENKRAGRLADMQSQLVRGMDDSYPGYKEARQVWSGGKRQEEALALGRDAFKADPRDFADRVAKLSDDEIAFARAGVVRSLDDVLNIPESYSAVRAQIRKPSFQQNMETLIGKEQADILIKNLEAEGRRGASARMANFANGSKTAPTAEAIQSLEVAVNSPARRTIGGAADLINRNGLNPANYVRSGTDRVVKAVNAPDESIISELATILSKPANKGAAELLERGIGQTPAQQRQIISLIKDKKDRALIMGVLTAKEGRKGLPLYAGGVALDE